MQGRRLPMEDKFTWTREYRKSWEEEAGEAKTSLLSPTRKYSPNRKNIIRHLHIAIDTSASIEKPDYLPTIRNQITNHLPPFIGCFHSMNPLSILSFMTCRDTFKRYSKTFEPAELLGTVGSGSFSLFNCLRAAVEILKCSSYVRECLLVTASIGTMDSASCDEILHDARRHGIRVSIISICGEVTVFKKAAELTGGLFLVPLNSNHFEMILNDFAFPLESSETTNTLVKFGFPTSAGARGLCCCHLSFHDDLQECPVCRARVCSLPVQCPICETQLISPLNISKSYHYMYPLKPFAAATGTCRCCQKEGARKCTDCESVYCTSCSDFLCADLNFCLYCK